MDKENQMISQTSLKDRVHLWDFMVGLLGFGSFVLGNFMHLDVWIGKKSWIRIQEETIKISIKGMDNLGKFYGFGYEDRICFRN